VARILVIGSIALDEVVHLDSPLRPGGHLAGHWQGARVGGGAANTAMALARAGDEAVVISAVGADEYGTWLVREIEALGVITKHIHRHAAETTRSLIVLDLLGERTVINLARAPVPLPWDLAEMAADACYVRSTDPALTPILQQRVARGGLVVAHVPPTAEGSRPAQVLVASASDLDPAFLADPFAAARRVAGETLEWLVLTRGGEGATAYGRDWTLRHGAPKIEVVDSTGAGDVFAAGLTHALARGMPMREALRHGVDWGAASVRYAGTVPPPDFPPDPGTEDGVPSAEG
jgi:ribokinase